MGTIALPGPLPTVGKFWKTLFETRSNNGLQVVSLTHEANQMQGFWLNPAITATILEEGPTAILFARHTRHATLRRFLTNSPFSGGT